jgi:DNA-binding FadR family transcriptional regulator
MVRRARREPLIGDAADERGDEAPSPAAEAIARLGQEIVAGVNYQAGSIVTLDAVSADLGITKAIAREVFQALSLKGLIETQPRVGSTIQPLDRWDVLDEDVVRWRLAASSTHAQMRSRTSHQVRSIMELRNAVEPAATTLAATRAPIALCGDLIGLAYRLKELGNDPGFKEVEAIRLEYRDVDARFHTAILVASQNELFKALAHVVLAAMDHRIENEWAGNAAEEDETRAAGHNKLFPNSPEAVALWFHVFVAHAIDQGRPRAALAFSRGLLSEVDGDLLTDEGLLADINDALYELRLAKADREEFKRELASAQDKARNKARGGE